MKQMQQQMQQMQQRLDAQDAQLAQFKAASDQTWLNEKRTQEVKALVKEVLADADTRASLLEGGMTAGHNGGFFLASEDGSFLMKMAGTLQMRYVVNSRDGDSATTDEDRQGFDMRRAELAFYGTVANPKLSYYIQFASKNDGANTSLQGVSIGYNLSDALKVTGGRVKLPLLREEIISSNMQLCMERSLVNTVFTGAYGEGIQLTYTLPQIKLSAMLSDGLKSGDVTPVDDFDNDDVDYALTGRVDWILAGKWSQFKDFNAWSGEDMGILLGGAIHYQFGESGIDDIAATPNVFESSNDATLVWTVDGYFENKGLSFYNAVMGKHVEDGTGLASGNKDDYGYLAQVGCFMIPDKFQPYVRYEWLMLDKGNQTIENDLQLFTVGANYYFRKDKCRLSVDMVYALDPVLSSNSSSSVSGHGLINDTAGEDGQIALRAELQVKF